MNGDSENSVNSDFFLSTTIVVYQRVTCCQLSKQLLDKRSICPNRTPTILYLILAYSCMYMYTVVILIVIVLSFLFDIVMFLLILNQ